MTNKKKVSIPNMVIALLLAVALWGYCIIEINPTSDVTIKNIPIIYQGADELNKANLAVISERPETISVTIGGQRAAISKLKAEDFIVTCDLENLLEGDNRISVNVKAPDGIQVENQSIKALSLIVERIITQARDITGVIVNQEADSDVAKILSMSKNSVNITGPKSLVESVARVLVKVDATKLGNEPVSLEIPLEAVDDSGKLVDGITLGRASVKCQAMLVSPLVDPLDEPDTTGDEDLTDSEDQDGDGIVDAEDPDLQDSKDAQTDLDDEMPDETDTTEDRQGEEPGADAEAETGTDAQ